MSAYIDHEVLGGIRGVVDENGKTVSYRGLKYAEIPGRWRDPILVSKQEGEINATEFGPSCPQNPMLFKFDLGLVGDIDLELENEELDEFECLNLAVTVPAGKNPKDLPVFVWVHGGGFSYGGNSWPQYQIQNFVATSGDIGKPVIGVSVNYRVGVFGFLASEELGTTGNFGLKDQACAFKWIKKHIAGFGGDPNRVTAAGESAGSICLHTLLLTSEPLFNRAILMSGDTTLRRPRTMAWQNEHYGKNVDLLGLSGSTPAARKDAFYNTPALEMVKKLPAVQHWSPTVDGKFILGEVTLGMLSDVESKVGKPSWCEAIMIGDVEYDGTVLRGRIMDDPNVMSRLASSLEKTLTPHESKRLLEKYSLAGTPSPEQQYQGLLHLSTDLRFHFPVLKTVEGWANTNLKCFRYHFHQQNEIDGKYKGIPSHELDVAYLLQTVSSYLSPESQELSKKMGEVWIDMTYGPPWTKQGDILVIGPDGKLQFVSEKEYGEKEEYRHERATLLQEMGWEKAFKLGELLQGV